MRKLLLIALMVVMAVFISPAHAKGTAQAECKPTHDGIRFYRAVTWKRQDALGISHTRASKARIIGCSYARWVAHLWQHRAFLLREKYERHQHFMATVQTDPVSAISYVFGPYARDAIGVARCESNLRTWAQNGQYLGLFQMGSSERRIYGHGNDALTQAQAAYRYFIASGKGWGPWQCQPSGGLQW